MASETKTCAHPGCNEEEWRVGGYCSTECRDMHVLELDLREEMAGEVAHALALAEALEKLANEVQALGAFREEMREAIGTTNLRVLEIRRDEARSALALYRGEEVQDGE